MVPNLVPNNLRPIEEVKLSIQQLYDVYLSGSMARPQAHEVNPGLEIGSRENYIYFTLPCAINYQRNSPALWASALKAYLDEETRFLFEPSEVANRPFEEVQAAMVKHKLALKTNKDPEAWQRLSTTFHRLYQDDPRAILAEAGYSIGRMAQIVQKEKKEHFPYIGGIKLSNYWMFILSRFTDAKFSDPFELSIIPDVHVIRATKVLGLAEEGVKPEKAEQIWRPILKDLGIAPADMHSALWLWSWGGFAVQIEGVKSLTEKPFQTTMFGDEDSES